ncbi:copper resistance CopC family protein [Actinoplanes sp. NPDC023714]|uniref:copper resistance CopC family protein n=1 Tax=Actinoplanes sp. NPDC023714 TaxID=3154322 RepID=UPI0033FDAC81
MKRLLLALAVLAAVLAPGTPAWAHATLVAADPARDAALAQAPATVSLRFNERLNPDFTTIVLSDAARQRIPASDVAVHDMTGTVTVTGPLSDGVYTVAYRVVSVDGHTVQGSYPVTVGAVSSPEASAVAVAAGSGGLPAGTPIAVAAAGLLLIAAAALLVRSRRR